MNSASTRNPCFGCFRPKQLCICERCRPVHNQTDILILQHQRERTHPFGTTRIALMTLRRSQRIVTFGAMPKPELSDRVALLYPSEHARDLSQIPAEEQPEQLIILDGTWPQARVIYRENPWLQDLDAVSLTPSEPGRYRIRLEPKPQYISTIESIISALRIIEPDTPDLDHPLEVFQDMIEEQVQITKESVSQRDYSLYYEL